MNSGEEFFTTERARRKLSVFSVITVVSYTKG